MTEDKDAIIADLRSQIADLEEALCGAVWPTSPEVSKLRIALLITPQAAKIMLLLYKMQGGLSASALGAAVSASDVGDAIVRTILSRIYRKGLSDWFDRRRGRGGEIALSPHGRRGVRAILEADEWEAERPPYARRI